MAEELRREGLGGLHITRGGTPSDCVSSKAPALLVYLAVPGRLHCRTTLAALLGSALPEEDARRKLRVVLADLRQTLAAPRVITREPSGFDRASAYVGQPRPPQRPNRRPAQYAHDGRPLPAMELGHLKVERKSPI